MFKILIDAQRVHRPDRGLGYIQSIVLILKISPLSLPQSGLHLLLKKKGGGLFSGGYSISNIKRR